MNLNSLYGFKSTQTQGYTSEGFRVPLTHIKMDSLWVSSLKSENSAVQIALGKKKNTSKALQGIVKNFTDKITPLVFRELKLNGTDGEAPVVGTKINVADVFNSGDKIKVTGVIKGKGFQGVMRRHGFTGSRQTHGASTKHRHPGSIGQTTTPGRVYKGKRMGGHMGNTTVSIKGLEVFEVKPEENILVVIGMVPGGKNALLKVTKQ